MLGEEKWTKDVDAVLPVEVFHGDVAEGWVVWDASVVDEDVNFQVSGSGLYKLVDYVMC